MSARNVRLDHLLGVYRVGSGDWAWREEYDNLINQPDTQKLLARIRAEGIREPILLGTDGRIWDGHHRIIIAMHLGLDSVPVEFAGEDGALNALIAEKRAEWEAGRSGLTPEQINALPVGAVVMTETNPATFGAYEQRVWQKFGGVPEWQFGFPRHEWQSTDGGFERVGQSDRHRGQFGAYRRVTLLWVPVNENGETP